jgi:signal transduction histidine kinase
MYDALGQKSLLAHTLLEGKIQTIEAHSERLRGEYIITLAPLRSSTGKIFGAVFVARDITERKQAEEARALLLTREQAARVETARLLQESKKHEEELRALASELSTTEDRERRKLALSIHDSIGQMLSVVKLKLTGLQRQNGDERRVSGECVSGEWSDKTQQAPVSTHHSPLTTHSSDHSSLFAGELADILQLIDQLIQQTRGLTFDLYPAMLEDLGLVPTLNWYQTQYSQQTGIRVEIAEFGQAVAPPTPVLTYLFRAVKELLHNVAKHARAKEIVLSVHWQRQGVRIVVVDDGCGVDTSQLADHSPPRGGLGLIGIRERIASMGGKFVFESWPGRGTQVILEAPFGKR